MKKSLPKSIEKGRVQGGILGSTSDYGRNGAFSIKIDTQNFFLIISDQKGWDHVSISKPSKKLPTWKEMCKIKDMIFEKDECVIQYHPPEKDYINMDPGVLHLWRPQNESIPMPPKIMV